MLNRQVSIESTPEPETAKLKKVLSSESKEPQTPAMSVIKETPVKSPEDEVVHYTEEEDVFEKINEHDMRLTSELIESQRQAQVEEETE